jgi:hypothetical protein
MANHEQDAIDLSKNNPAEESDTALTEDDLKTISGGLISTGVGGDSGVCVNN